MKKSLLVIVILLLVLDILLNCMRHKEQADNTNDMYNHIDSIMQHRAHMDSLYWNHLEQCAFEAR